MDIEKAADGTYPVDINGRHYIFTKWGAERAFEVLAQLSDLTFEPLALLMGAQRKGKSDGVSIDEEMLGKALRSFTGAMARDPKVTTKLLKTLICEKSACDGRPIMDFNLHFKGRLGEMMHAAYAAVTVQYNDFFAAVSDMLPSAPAASQKSPDSEEGSTPAS